MELLRLSISNDGYTQPIVSMDNGDETREVIDGFHRNSLGKECAYIQNRVNGYLPFVTIRQSQKDKSNRIASTIRHNRARGKHSVDSMSEIIVDLKKRNWSPKKIGKELGMDADEVLRLSQISGLVELFKDKEFSNAWTTEEE
jgi:ParB-like chromosome segregation protein Spo0J